MNLSKITWPKELVRLHRLHWITDVRNWLLHNSPKISIIKTDLSLNRGLKCGKWSVYHDPNSEKGSFGTWPLSSRSATRSLAMGHLFLKVLLSFNKTISSSVKSLYCRITFVSDVGSAGTLYTTCSKMYKKYDAAKKKNCCNEWNIARISVISCKQVKKFKGQKAEDSVI